MTKTVAEIHAAMAASIEAHADKVEQLLEEHADLAAKYVAAMTMSTGYAKFEERLVEIETELDELGVTLDGEEDDEELIDVEVLKAIPHKRLV